MNREEALGIIEKYNSSDILWADELRDYEEANEVLKGIDKPNLITIQQWGAFSPNEIRVELGGNGTYLVPDNASELSSWIKENSLRIACEIMANLNSNK